jgi:hypothetical protein
LWDDLPLELNWKTYWGLNRDAAILHFHGPKPYNRAALREEVPFMHRHIYSEHFETWCDQWDEALSRVDHEAPI